MKKFKLHQAASKMVLHLRCRSSAERLRRLTQSQEAPSASVQRYGLTEVSAPAPASSAQVDVVFVHGLNGDPKHTWTSKTNNVFWPKDLLPSFVSDQNVRVLVYGYDADIVSFARKDAGITKDKIHNHAERLIADLFANRRVCQSNIILSPAYPVVDPEGFRTSNNFRGTFTWRAGGKKGKSNRGAEVLPW